MEEDLVAIERNDTWTLIKLACDNKAIEVKLMLKLKHNPDRSISKHKVGLVVRGFLHI